jgi:acetylornithine deacetylase
MLDATLKHLEALVAVDTRNPPRAIGSEIFDYLRQALGGAFRHTLRDHGAGSVSLLSVRGQPTRVFNFHLDTVPASPQWSADPLRLRIDGSRAVGLGACDIKGAAAAMVVAANATSGDVALLFTSDEEANDARGVAAFLAHDHGCSEAVVAEPTQCRARLAHRGLVSATAKFRGVPGHASAARALDDNAVHRAIGWGAKALAQARAWRDASFGELTGLPFNLGRIEGGIKGNVIAPDCEVRLNFRPLPSQSVDELLALLRGMSAPHELALLEETFRGPPLPAQAGAAADAALAAARRLATALGLECGPAVDFWTEASLFSQAGLTAIVYGPGDIAQAHAADEWVELAQLEQAAQAYARMLS